MLKKKFIVISICATLILSGSGCMFFTDTDLDDSPMTSSSDIEEHTSSNTSTSEDANASSSTSTSNTSSSSDSTSSTSSQNSQSTTSATTTENTDATTPNPSTSENNIGNDYTPREYVVVSGDTWWGIGQKFGLRYEFLLEYNQMNLEDGLSVGEILKIPSEAEIKDKNLSIARIREDEITVPVRQKGELRASHEGYEYAYSANDVKRAMYTKEQLLDGKKMCFLTYDDGIDSESTSALLDDLESLNIPATFFVVGNTINHGNSYLLQRMVDEGHSIANHSYNHDYELLYPSKTANPVEIERQFLKTDSLFRHVLGENFISNLWRYPGGGSSWSNINSADEILNSYGVVELGWNTLNDDALGVNEPQTAEEQVDAIFRHWRYYGSPSTIVVLMHDKSDKTLTREALPAIVTALRDEGFEFGTIY